MTAPDIRPRDLDTVRAILRAHLPRDARAWVFGSRATGRARPASDLDLAIDAQRPLTLDECAVLNDAFDQSDLPYTVDVVDCQTVAASFWAIIQAEQAELDVGEP